MAPTKHKNSSVRAGPNSATIVNMFTSSYRRCYCAFCKRPRRVFVKRHLAWTDVLGVALLAAVATGLIWRQLEPRGVMIFVSLLVVAEFLVQIRWRVGLACATCGFDPLIYSRNPDRAAEKVRDFYRRRSEQPDFLLTAQNLIETQKRIQKVENARSALKRAQGAHRQRSSPVSVRVDPSGVTSGSTGKNLSRTV
jgi:hypothetical protein